MHLSNRPYPSAHHHTTANRRVHITFMCIYIYIYSIYWYSSGGTVAIYTNIYITILRMRRCVRVRDASPYIIDIYACACVASVSAKASLFGNSWYFSFYASRGARLKAVKRFALNTRATLLCPYLSPMSSSVCIV